MCPIPPCFKSIVPFTATKTNARNMENVCTTSVHTVCVIFNEILLYVYLNFIKLYYLPTAFSPPLKLYYFSENEK